MRLLASLLSGIFGSDSLLGACSSYAASSEVFAGSRINTNAQYTNDQLGIGQLDIGNWSWMIGFID